jgi:uncharacterized membrane protein (DUF4010 family)
MDETEILIRLGLALAIGFLIGVERGWREREEKEGDRTAGIRTFALIGLFGGVWGLLARVIGPAPLGLAFLALAGAVTLFRWRETERQGIFGMTTLVAAFLAFSLGAYAVLGDMIAAAAAGVATAALLAAKEWLHAWLRVLTWPELRAALILLAMTFVALPVLPDRGFGPYEALNPYQLWLMSIVIAGVSFIGYVAAKIAGERHGALIAGAAGGLVSSTAATLDFSRRARAAASRWPIHLSGALAAAAVMFARVLVIVALFGPALLASTAAPLAAAAIVAGAAAVAINRPWARHGKAAGDGGQGTVRNPFELTFVLGFAALLAIILLLTRILTDYLGSAGGVALAAVAGIADVDAITLSMTRLAGGDQAGLARTAILVAVAVNSLSRSVLALAVAGRRFGLAYLGIMAAALAAGAAAILVSG